ncbi:Heme/hemopexin utilization protein C [Mannheimia haemolytica]|nr:hypothetical protein J450_08390 [Mannheimia haemolytica D171]
MQLSKLSLAITVSLFSANIFANQSIELDTVNVIATRDPSKFADTPQKQTKDALLVKQATSVAVALKALPNVDVQGGARAIA